MPRHQQKVRCAILFHCGAEFRREQYARSLEQLGLFGEERGRGAEKQCDRCLCINALQRLLDRAKGGGIEHLRAQGNRFGPVLTQMGAGSTDIADHGQRLADQGEHGVFAGSFVGPRGNRAQAGKQCHEQRQASHGASHGYQRMMVLVYAGASSGRLAEKKNRSISRVASGPLASAKDASPSPPDHAWPAPCTSQCSKRP